MQPSGRANGKSPTPPMTLRGRSESRCLNRSTVPFLAQSLLFGIPWGDNKLWEASDVLELVGSQEKPSL